MSFDSATYISQFNISYPEDDATKCATDITTLKTVLTNTFVDVSAEISASQGHLNIAVSGGTISGSLMIKGTLSASSVNATHFNVSTSASPAANTEIVFDNADNHICYYAGAIKRIAPGGTMMLKRQTTQPSYTSDGTATLMAAGSILGEQWTSSTAAITPPRGVYEISAKLTFQGSASSSTSFNCQLQLLKSGNIVAESRKPITTDMLLSGAKPTVFLYHIDELTLSETLTIQMVNTGGTGNVTTHSGQDLNSVMVKKL